MATSSRLRPVVLLLVGLLLTLGLAAAVILLTRVPGAQGEPPEPQLDAALEIVEEPTEAFANSLHDCSVGLRRGDLEQVATCFAATLAGTQLPSAPAPEEEEFRWIRRRNWALPPAAGALSRDDFMASLERFLGHFSEVEDVRLKVKHSQVVVAPAAAGEEHLEGSVALDLVGRDGQGRREWTRGRARIEAVLHQDGIWKITHFHLESLDSLLSTRDIFIEVAAAAGLHAVDPAVMDHPTLGLAAYGAAAADVDGDGLMDLFTTGQQGNSLYLNHGDGTFTEAAARVWLRHLPRPATAPLFFDMDNDGDVDLFMSANGEPFLFENRLLPEGVLRFDDVSAAAGINRAAVGFSVAAGDLDGNGYTDLYVASYNHYGRILPDSWDGASNGTPNLLFMNQGDGTFREEAAQRGVDDGRWSYAAAMADVDGDGRLDIYVANDFGGGNALYLNRGATFEDVAESRGVADHGYCMGVSFADYDNDGDLDLHVTKMSSTAGRRILARLGQGALPQRDRLEELAVGNALYANNGDGTFTPESAAAGPFAAGWAWGGGFVDLDNDGWEDLHTPNGFLSGASMKDT